MNFKKTIYGKQDNQDQFRETETHEPVRRGERDGYKRGYRGLNLLRGERYRLQVAGGENLQVKRRGRARQERGEITCPFA